MIAALGKFAWVAARTWHIEKLYLRHRTASFLVAEDDWDQRKHIHTIVEEL